MTPLRLIFFLDSAESLAQTLETRDEQIAKNKQILAQRRVLFEGVSVDLANIKSQAAGLTQVVPKIKASVYQHAPKVVAEKKPLPVVICGPSGVGKGTLIGKLMKEFPDTFGFCVSHTTRKPRDGEVNAVHYHFSTKEKVAAEIAEGKFLEYAEVHGNYYGTSLAAVDAVAAKGKICILDIDVQGAEKVKLSSMKARYVFVLPPSFEDLEARLRGRGTESEESLQKRLKNAHGEMKKAEEPGFFDAVVVNDDLDLAYNNLKAFMQGKKLVKQALPVKKQPTVVLSGPGGSSFSCSDIITALANRFPDRIGFPVCHTSRTKRDHEAPGEDYHFTTVEKMLAEVKDGKFVEHAEVRGIHYGTSLAAVHEVQQQGRVCLLDMDVPSSIKFSQSSLEAKYFYVCPTPSDADEQAEKTNLYHMVTAAEDLDAICKLIAEALRL
ncbi:Guanylate kinase 2 [Cymbomonas tetramitiformis]|uniref:Guanylate kinase 1 n=1 Tax=Cymbomonas tetramitiformis TaxID=36881 RepID=A0AAE0EUQ1_9CHLO|nr:Guanylate kinase 2 [Cymbomonas tetramitiformis]